MHEFSRIAFVSGFSFKKRENRLAQTQRAKALWRLGFPLSFLRLKLGKEKAYKGVSMSNLQSNPSSPSPTPQTPPKHSSLKGWIVIGCCVLALCFCVMLYVQSPKKAGSEVMSRTITLTDVGFDTPVTFKTTCSETEFNQYVQIVQDTFNECKKLFDAFEEYDDQNSLYTINNAGVNVPTSVDKKFFEVWTAAQRAHALNQKFDVAQGKLTFLWKEAFEAETPALPSEADIQASLNPASMGAVEVNKDNQTVTLLNEQVALDFGAIAKGYTAQLAANRLQEAGLEWGFLNAGGNVVLIGQKPDGESWKVGIQNPDSAYSLLMYETKEPTSLVTSGDYQRYMVVDGKRYAHIIDPTTGYPAAWMRSVTVIHEDSAYCDAMSTALFCMSIEEGMKLCESIGLDAIWIADAEKDELPAEEPFLKPRGFYVYVTSGLKDSVTLKQDS